MSTARILLLRLWGKVNTQILQVKTKTVLEREFT